MKENNLKFLSNKQLLEMIINLATEFSIKNQKDVLKNAELLFKEAISRGFKFDFVNSCENFLNIAKIVLEKISDEVVEPRKPIKSADVYYAIDYNGSKLYELNKNATSTNKHEVICYYNQEFEENESSYWIRGNFVEILGETVFVNKIAYNIPRGCSIDFGDFVVENKNGVIILKPNENVDFKNIENMIVSELISRNIEFNEMSEDIDKISIIPGFVGIVGSYAKNPEIANDMDIIIRANKSEEFADEFTLAVIQQLIKYGRFPKRPHFVLSAISPHDKFIPLYDLVLVPSKLKYEIEKVNALTLKFTPIKTKGGYGEYTFSASNDGIKSCYQVWAQGFLANNIPIVVEKKFDGLRMIVRKEGDEIKITTEDTDKPINDVLCQDLISELISIKHSYILDGELELYAEDDFTLNHEYKKGDKIERIDMKTVLSKQFKFSCKYHVFDIVYFDGESLLENVPYFERKKILNKLIPKNFKHVSVVDSIIVKNFEELRDAILKVAKEKYSEGAMLKALNFVYSKSGRSPMIAKIKNYKEIICKVVNVKQTKDKKAYLYDCVVEDDIPIGTTYVTDMKFNKGDIIEVRVAEVKYKNGQFTWDNPIVHSKKPKGTALTTKSQLLALAKLKRGFEILEGDTKQDVAIKNWKENWYKAYPKTEKPRFVIQHHYRGLSEVEIEGKRYKIFSELLDNDDKLKLFVFSKEDFEILINGELKNILGIPIERLMDEKSLLKRKVSVHTDLRLETDKQTLHGWTLFEDAKNIKKYGDELMVEDRKIRCIPKIFQPYAWVIVGIKQPYIAEPMTPGASNISYAKFFAYDYGYYQPGVWNRSFNEYFLEGQKISGRIIIQHVTDKREDLWFATKPKNQEPYSSRYTKEEVIRNLKNRGHKLLIWREPGKKPEFIEL